MNHWYRILARGHSGHMSSSKREGRYVSKRNSEKRVVPRSTDVDLGRAVALIARKHGDTLRELADR